MERLVFHKWKFQVVVWIKEGMQLRLRLERETWASLAGQVILELESAVTQTWSPSRTCLGTKRWVWKVLHGKPKLFWPNSMA